MDQSRAAYNLRIEGLQQAQANNRNRILAIQPGGVVDEEIKRLVIGSNRYAMYVTHVDTGALRASHRMYLRPMEGEVSVSMDTYNPRSGRAVHVYAEFEHARGGSHAFYARTVAEYTKPELERSKQRIAKVILYGR